MSNSQHWVFSRGGVVSTSPKPQAGGPPLVGCPRLLILFIHSYPPYRRPFLHPQREDAPCRGDRDPHSWSIRHYQPLFRNPHFVLLLLKLLYLRLYLSNHLGSSQATK